MYLHTLKVGIDNDMVKKGKFLATLARFWLNMFCLEYVFDNLRYTQAQSRGRPTLIEADLTLPKNRTTKIILDVDKAYMRYTDYPPDAHRGFDVPSGIVLLLEDNAPATRIYTTSTLLDMPTPDFSMPYNVIIMTCEMSFW